MPWTDIAPWSEIAPWCGWAGCALSGAFAIPQAVRLLRVASPAGVAMLPWQALLAANLAWSIYAAFTRQPPLLASYGLAAALAVFVIGRLALGTSRRLLVALGAPAALALCMLLALPFPALFGIVTIVPSTIGWIAQLLRIRRAGRPPGLSAASMLLYFLCLCVWLAYALMLGDVALATSTVPLIVVIGATLAAYLVAPVCAPAAEPRAEATA